MKKFLAVAIFGLIALSASAQNGSPVVQMKGAIRGTNGDTISNTGTIYDSILLSVPYGTGIIEAQVNAISGTVAGKITVQGRLVNLTTTNTSTWVTLTDTASVSVTNGHEQSYYFPLPGVQKIWNSGSVAYPAPSKLPFYQYRVLWTGTGTMSGWMKSYFAGRQ